MKKSLLAGALLALCGTTAFAEFEGVIHMKVTSPGGGGTVKIMASKPGMRNEMDFRAEKGPGSMRMIMLFRHDNPDKAYQINEAARTYSEIDLKEARAQAAKMQGQVSVKKLAPETVGGYKCQHVLVTAAGAETELWTSQEILDYSAVAKVMGPRSGINDSYYKALKDAGADGFPVKSVTRGQGDGAVTTMELVGVQKTSLAPALFELPAGYTKSGGPSMGGPAGGAQMPPDAMKAMQEQMKNMPAEQREMIEKMMRQRGGK